MDCGRAIGVGAAIVFDAAGAGGMGEYAMAVL